MVGGARRRPGRLGAFDSRTLESSWARRRRGWSAVSERCRPEAWRGVGYAGRDPVEPERDDSAAPPLASYSRARARTNVSQLH